MFSLILLSILLFGQKAYQQSEKQPTEIEIIQALRDTIKNGLDTNKDNYISREELNSWLSKLHIESIKKDIERQWIYYDPLEQEVHSWDGYFPEKKQVLVWDHYFNATYPELTTIHLSDIDPKNERLQQLKQLSIRAQNRWTAADANGDSLLTREEFNHFAHPEEGNERTRELFLAAATEDLDANNDRKVTLDEFVQHIKSIGQEDGKDDEWVEGQRSNFINYLDRNKDAYLDAVELRQWLIPDENERHLLEVERLFAVGDVNSDNELSIDEILKHHDQMASLLPTDFWTKNQAKTTVRYSQSSHDEF